MACAQEEELQYFEALMLQCEQWGHSQAAAQFAQAALHEVEKVYADHNAPLAEQGRQQWLALRHQREDRLCTHLFVYALDGGQYAVSFYVNLPLFHPALVHQLLLSWMGSNEQNVGTSGRYDAVCIMCLCADKGG